MMSELPTRLTEAADALSGAGQSASGVALAALLREAAAEIERQEADARKVFDMLLRDHEALAQERDALRALASDLGANYHAMHSFDYENRTFIDRAKCQMDLCRRARSASEKEQTVG